MGIRCSPQTSSDVVGFTGSDQYHRHEHAGIRLRDLTPAHSPEGRGLEDKTLRSDRELMIFVAPLYGLISATTCGRRTADEISPLENGYKVSQLACACCGLKTALDLVLRIAYV